jgi:hypothetical protein
MSTYLLTLLAWGVVLAESEAQNTLFYSSLLLLLLICFVLSNPFFQKRARMLTMRERDAILIQPIRDDFNSYRIRCCSMPCLMFL